MLRNFGSIIAVSLILFMSACSNKDEDPVIEPENKIVDLSKDEMANCYIVTSPGVYKFKADNQFNLGPGLPEPDPIHPVDASLVWQTSPGLITSVELNDEDGNAYIEFEVSQARGNALLAALDEDGNIEWSWHIWMPEEEIQGVKSDMGYYIMNMNLGAMNNNPGDIGSYGMLYQWGRKDPLPASPTLTGDMTTVGAPLYDMEGNPVAITNSSWYDNECNTIEYSIAHPTVCLSNYSQYSKTRDWLSSPDDTLWGNPFGDVRNEFGMYSYKGEKTCYDPSPAGWKVAPADAFYNFTSTGGYAWNFDDFRIEDTNGDGEVNLDDYNYGWNFKVSNNDALFFPAAARYDGSYAMLMGSVSGIWGNYWTNAPYIGIAGGAFCGLSFQVAGQNGEEWISVSPAAGASRADAYSVRCVRDK